MAGRGADEGRRKLPGSGARLGPRPRPEARPRGLKKPHVERRKATRPSPGRASPKPDEGGGGRTKRLRLAALHALALPFGGARGERRKGNPPARAVRARRRRSAPQSAPDDVRPKYRPTRHPPKSTVMKTSTRTKTRPNANTLPDQPPADIDALRYELARRINQFMSDRRRAWRTCQEPACRRHRCCQAPRIQCSNAPPPRPDPDGRRAALARARVARALRDLQGRQGEPGEPGS